MSIFKKKKIMVIVDNNDVPVDPRMRRKVKFKGKVKQTKQIALGLLIIILFFAVIISASIFLWEMVKPL